MLDEKNPHIRNNRDGTVVKLDVNNGVYTIDIWDLPRAAFDKPVRPAALCRVGAAGKKKWNDVKR